MRALLASSPQNISNPPFIMINNGSSSGNSGRDSVRVVTMRKNVARIITLSILAMAFMLYWGEFLAYDDLGSGGIISRRRLGKNQNALSIKNREKDVN